MGGPVDLAHGCLLLAVWLRSRACLAQGVRPSSGICDDRCGRLARHHHAAECLGTDLAESKENTGTQACDRRREGEGTQDRTLCFSRELHPVCADAHVHGWTESWIAFLRTAYKHGRANPAKCRVCFLCSPQLVSGYLYDFGHRRFTA